MFSLGVICLFLGYAFAYTGWMNLTNGGQGPTITESLGLRPRGASGLGQVPGFGSAGQSGSRSGASGTPQPKAV